MLEEVEVALMGWIEGSTVDEILFVRVMSSMGAERIESDSGLSRDEAEYVVTFGCRLGGTCS